MNYLSKSTKGSGRTFLPMVLSKGSIWSGKSQKWLQILVRHRDLADRETVGAVQWVSLCSKLRHAFQSEGAQTCSDSHGQDYIQKGTNKTRFQHCTNSNNSPLYVRAIQVHSGGELIAPDLMNHVAMPLRCEEFLYHSENSCTVNSFLQGLIEGAKDTEEGRQTVFFTSSEPFGDEAEEEYDDELSRPRKVHYKNKSKVSHDAVCWDNLGKRTRERIAILADKVSRHSPLRLSASRQH